MSRIKLRITGLSYSHSQTEAYALILAEAGESKRRLPIIIGKNEAQAIAIYLEKIEPPRPLSYDLIKVITDIFHGNIKEVGIVKLLSGIFYAEICLTNDTRTFRIDARVSDAVALALRFDIPVYCEESIMEAASFILEEEPHEEIEQEAPKGLSSFHDYSVKQLQTMMQDAIKKENYERAARLKKELQKRKQTNN